MAAPSRVPPTGSPTVGSAAVPSYSRTSPGDRALTGTYAVPRDPVAAAAQAAAPGFAEGVRDIETRAAAARAEAAGLPSTAVPSLVDYFESHGSRFPELSLLSSGQGGGFSGAGGGSSTPLGQPAATGLPFGLSMNMAIGLGVAALGLVLLMRRKGK